MRKKTNSDDLPSVSIIIPTYNAEKTVDKCLQAVLNQTYPQRKYEIIVVDNGSKDKTPQVISNFSVELLFENKIRSPYAARNRGLERAKGEVIVFLDASCIPETGWLKNGITTMIESQADLAGGNVIFDFGNSVSAAKIVDSMINVRMKESIEQRKAAYGGNLFVRREIKEKIGFFPEGIRSGGDVRWTSKAVQNGFKLIYAEQAIVRYPARNLKSLIKKRWRIAKTLPTNWQEVGRSANLKGRWKNLINPLSVENLRSECPEYAVQYFDKKKYKIWCIWYSLQLLAEIGILYGLLKNSHY